MQLVSYPSSYQVVEGRSNGVTGVGIIPNPSASAQQFEHCAIERDTFTACKPHDILLQVLIKSPNGQLIHFFRPLNHILIQRESSY